MNKNIIDPTIIVEHMIGMVRKAITIIQEESHHIDVTEKLGYDGQLDDKATNGDKKAQAMYIEHIREHFPLYGVIAEEAELTIPCIHPTHKVYFTVDPLDGTKAYVRGQSHGVGTMIAFVCDDEVVAVAIGDANTSEIYHYGINNHHGIVYHERFGKTKPLTSNAEPLAERYLFLREAPNKQPKVIAKAIGYDPDYLPLFKDIEVGGGSIGLCFARLWNGEIGGIVLRPGYTTPWDETPLIGICQQLGFQRYRIDPRTSDVEQHNPQPETRIIKRDYSEIIIHGSHHDEFMAWLEARKFQ